MPLLTHTCRRGGIYHFRIRIPRDLVVRFQQKELKASLRTTNPNVARNRSLSATQHCLRLFDLVRRDVMLKPDQIRELAQKHFQALLQQDRQERRLLGGAKAFAGLPIAQRALDLDQRAQQLACLDFGNIAPRVTALLAEAGYEAGADGQAFEMLCELVLRAELSAVQIQQYRDKANFYSEPDDPLFRQTSVPALANGWTVPLTPPAARSISTPEEAEALGLSPLALMPLSEFVEHVIDERGLDGRRGPQDGEVTTSEAKPKKKSVAPKYRAVVRALIAIAGDKPVYQYRRLDFIKLKKLLMKTPANYTQRGFKSIVDAAEANEKAARKLPLLATITINDGYLTYINQVFQFAYDNGGALKNEVDGIRVEVNLSNKTSAVDARDPFDIADFNKIYTAPLYVGAKSDHHWHDHGQNHFDRGHRFWTMPGMQFGGFRSQEFGQALLADVKNGEEYPYPCIEITNKIDREDYVGASEELIKKLELAKKIKTTAARRTIPVHPVLIALGFLEHVEEQRACSEVRLFAITGCACDLR